MLRTLGHWEGKVLRWENAKDWGVLYLIILDDFRASGKFRYDIISELLFLSEWDTPI